jgi:hypothetical protein
MLSLPLLGCSIAQWQEAESLQQSTVILLVHRAGWDLNTPFESQAQIMRSMGLYNSVTWCNALVSAVAVRCPPQMKDEASDGNKAAAEAAAQRGNLLMNALWSIVGGGRSAESAGEAVLGALLCGTW